jgi:hypothetical protein
MSERRDDFLLEEYKALRQEILLRLQHEFNIHRYTMVAVAAVYVAAFSNDHLAPEQKDTALAKIIWAVPFGLVLVGMGFYAVYDFVVQKQGIYIRDIEDHFLGRSNPKGWERWFSGGKQKNAFMGIANKLFIGVILSPFWQFAFWVTLIVMLKKNPVWPF